MAGIGFGIILIWPASILVALAFFIPMMVPGINALLLSKEDQFYSDIDPDVIESFCEWYAEAMATAGIMPTDTVADVYVLNRLYNSSESEAVVHAIEHMLNKVEEIDGIHDLQQTSLPTVRDGKEPAEGQGN